MLIRHHPPRIQDILRRAGMSMQSELTVAEITRAERAADQFTAESNTPRNRIYNMIFPNALKETSDENESATGSGESHPDRSGSG